METKKINLANIGEDIILEIVDIIARGGVIVVPTDTVYGLICDATSKEAIDRIYKIKKRNRNKPVGVFVCDINMAKKYAKIDSDNEPLLETANTYVLPSEGILAFGDTLGVRLPKSEFIRRITKELGVPLVQTSANISGRPSTNSINEIITLFESEQEGPDLVLNAGDLPERKSSRVIDLTGDRLKILRD
jgi:L-threonylcarbamoyladenylate synthase